MDMCPAFLLLLLACSAQVTFGKTLFTSAECDLDRDPLCDTVHLVKRSAASDSCSDWECIGNVCTCHDGKSKRSASGGDNVDSGDNSLPSARDIIDSTNDEIRKDFEKNPLLSGLVKRNAASDSCSAESAGCAPGTEPASINNVCKCLTPEQLQNEMGSTMDKIRKDFEKNPFLSGLVKRSASEGGCTRYPCPVRPRLSVDRILQ